MMKRIRLGGPEWAEVRGTLSVPARVEADETRITRVGSPVTGRITELEVMEGQTVKRGQVLALLHSTELSDTQFGYLRAVSQRQLAARAVDRARQLVGAGVIGEAELQRRDAELTQATAEVSTWHNQLQVLGMSDEAMEKLESSRAVNSVAQIVASMDGTVLERRVTLGQVVQPADTVFVVADLSSVWLVADVPEQAAGYIRIGKDALAEVPALPGATLHGKISFVSALVNAETHTVRVRMDLPNPDGLYKPAMLSTMMLADRPERKLVLPASAIVREANRDHVFVQAAERTFVLREVTLAGEYGDNRVLAGGLRDGEKIALDGAFHLNTERKKAALKGE
jgi:cobalt-zinc-cadmium efflux system membrane fusion protein